MTASLYLVRSLETEQYWHDFSIIIIPADNDIFKIKKKHLINCKETSIKTTE